MLRVETKSPEETLAVGRCLALAVPPICEEPECQARHAPCLAYLLSGPLGAGKTTLVRGLVESLPGGQNAEVASPSFNIVNLYPTRPEIAHFDLYRLGESAGAGLDDVLEELAPTTGGGACGKFGPGGKLAVVEWVEHLPEENRPPCHVHISLTPLPNGPDGPDGRELVFTAQGEVTEVLLDRLAGELRQAGFSVLQAEPA